MTTQPRTSTAAPDKPKQRKTLAQRAQEALGVAERRHAKARDRVTAAEKELTAAKADVADAKSRLDYLAGDPALPKNQVVS